MTDAFPPPGAGRVVVVGAGTAGCVVARRLIDAGHDVMVLEAGPSSFASADHRLSDLDHFRAHTVAERWWAGASARRTSRSGSTPYLIGRGLGGSSAVNGAMAEFDPDDPALAGIGDVGEAAERLLVPVEPARAEEMGALSGALLDAGVGRPVRLARRGARRVDAGSAYLEGLTPGSFELVGGTSVDRLELDVNGGPVVVTVSGSRIGAAAVVLCAGAIHTPAILLRSELGESVGIHVQDHPSVALHLRFRDGVSRPSRSALVTGAIAERDGLQVLPLERLAPIGASSSEGALLVALMEPAGSAGTISLSSSGESPSVNLRLDSDERDVERLLDGVDWAIELLASADLRRVVERVSIDDIGTPVSVLSDRERARDWVRRGAGAHHHVAGSCGIGRALHRDGSLLGAERVFVADASAFGVIPRTGTHLPTLVLAEMLTRRWST